jgi:iron complex outermembrane receptor protein
LNIRNKPAWMPVSAALAILFFTAGAARSQTDAEVVDPNPEEVQAEEKQIEAQKSFPVGPEEIVVTARKREESLQDVPISISAFTADQLRESGAVNNYDVALQTPNFSTLQQTGRRQDRPVIRGQAAPANRGEPNASYFIDGAVVSGSISTTTLGPIERVEILRGPQSAQFGRATFAGAVNYVTRKPSNEWEGEVQTRAGTDDSYTGSVWGSGPLVEDKLLFFGSMGYDKYGGEWHNNLQEDQATIPGSFVDAPQQGDSSRLGNTETKDFLGKLLWQINDTSELTFKANYTHGDDGHYPQLIVETEEFNCYPDDNGDFQTYCGTLDVERVHTFDPEDPKNDMSRENRLNLPDIREGMTSTQYTPDLPGWQSQGEEVGTVRDQ